ncbi:hypothetical protein ACFWWM_40485 [Streptomyces sp. NPDC058682]|uniref:hypothetical protein n=1 Tax=Streptomyces sp. NPDC058682 TaxID=3346596 RepID=UPI003652157A
MAEQLIEAMSMKWGPDQVHDTFREKVASLIRAKQAGETVEKAEPAPQPTGAVDLMEALRASVHRARSPKDTKTEKASTTTRVRGGSGAGSAKKPAGEKRIRSASKTDLDLLTKADLSKKAAAADIPGRSHMPREDLVDALRSAS